MNPLLKRTRLVEVLSIAIFGLGASCALAQNVENDLEDNDSDIAEQDTMVVVGGRIEQSISDVAGSVSVMTEEDIVNQMVSDMAQLFQYEPGIEITGSNGTAQNFIVRGMGADRVMMIKDGMRMNEGYGANGANDIIGRGFIDVDTLKQVEVAKGAASSLYGADALGGIVAFRTKDAGDLLGAEDYYLSFNGDYDGRSTQIGAGILSAFRAGNFETLISYKNRNGNETQNFNDNRPAADVVSNSLLAKTDYIFSATQKLTFSFDYYKQEVDIPDDGSDKGEYRGLTGWTINSQESYNEKQNNSYQLRYQDTGNASIWYENLDVSVYLNQTEQTDLFSLNHDTPEPLGPGGYRDTVRDDLFSQVTWGVSLSASKIYNGKGLQHIVSYGFDWDSTDTLRDRIEKRTQSDGTVVRDSLASPFPKNSTERFGVYLQDSVGIGEKLTLIPGLRYDYYSLDPEADPNFDETTGGADVIIEKITDTNLSFRLGALYALGEDHTLFFQYAQGFKVPPYDLAYFYYDQVLFSGNGIRVIPANELVPEESDSFELGIRGSFGNLGYNFSAYQSDYDNFIQIAFVETIDEINNDFGFPFPVMVDVFQYQNIESAMIRGAEFRLDYSLGQNVTVFLNGQWMDSEDKSTGEQLTTIQPLSGTLGMNYYNGNFSMDSMLKWVDDMEKNQVGTFTSSGYTVLDIYARYSFGENLMLSLGLLNALDKEYVEYTSLAGIPDDGRNLDLFTQPGRTVSVRLMYTF